MDEAVELEDLGGVVCRTWGSGRGQTPLPRSLRVLEFIQRLPSEAGLSYDGDTPWLRDSQAHGF